MQPTQQDLNPKEQAVFNFIKDFHYEKGKVPSARQISQQFQFKSSRSAQNYITALKAKKAIKDQTPNTSSYCLWEQEDNNPARIPLLGSIAAGNPLMSFDDNPNQAITLPDFFGQHKDLFALQVIGDSMSGDNICHDDIAIISKSAEFNENDIFAVQVDREEYTLKRLKKNQKTMNLIASNPTYKDMEVPCEDVSISGRFIGLLRKSI